MKLKIRGADLPIPLVTADSPNMQCPSGGIVQLTSSIGRYAKIKGIPIVEVGGIGAVVGCLGHPHPSIQPDPRYRVYCTRVVNPNDCKAEKFKVLGKYVADAEKVNKLKTDKGFAISLPNPIAKPFIKR